MAIHHENYAPRVIQPRNTDRVNHTSSDAINGASAAMVQACQAASRHIEISDHPDVVQLYSQGGIDAVVAAFRGVKSESPATTYEAAVTKLSGLNMTDTNITAQQAQGAKAVFTAAIDTDTIIVERT